MDWLVVGAFVLVGLFLILAEVIFIPGTTVVGLLGFGVLSYGIYYAYAELGATNGHITLALSIVLTVALVVIAFRNRSYERFSLKDRMESRFNEGSFLPRAGQSGKTVSTLKPIGKALIEDHMIEVRSNGAYVEENVEIEVVSVEGTKIIVQPKNRA